MKYYVVNENYTVISTHDNEMSASVHHKLLWKQGYDVEVHTQDQQDKHNLRTARKVV